VKDAMLLLNNLRYLLSLHIVVVKETCYSCKEL
jgi:hypothetical protein